MEDVLRDWSWPRFVPPATAGTRRPTSAGRATSARHNLGYWQGPTTWAWASARSQRSASSGAETGPALRAVHRGARGRRRRRRREIEPLTAAERGSERRDARPAARPAAARWTGSSRCSTTAACERLRCRRDAPPDGRHDVADRAWQVPGQRRGRERSCDERRRPPTSRPARSQILTQVVAEYIATGHPVGSKTLVECGAVEASASTVRYELAELETRGLLDHPHTSAGRVPTDAGYRLYAEALLEQPLGAAALPVDLSSVRNEVDAALRIDHRDAVAGDIAAGGRHRAAAGDDRDPPHRGAAAPAAGGDGRHHHGHGRSDEADLPVPGRRSTRCWWSGRRFLNEQLAGVRLGARDAA